LIYIKQEKKLSRVLGKIFNLKVNENFQPDLSPTPPKMNFHPRNLRLKVVQIFSC